MPTLGEELKKRREARSISLSDIAEATKISTRYLKAIETDNYSVLPGGIFTRSFIRAYAKQVGMGEEEAVGLYHQQIAPPNPEPPPQVGSQTPKEASQSAREPGAERAVRTPPKRAEAEPRLPSPAIARPRRQQSLGFRQSAASSSWSTKVISALIVVFVLILIVALVRNLNRAGKEQSANTATAKAEVSKANPPPPGPSGSAQPGPSSPVQSNGVEPPKPAAGEAPPQSVSADALAVKIEASAGDSWLRYQVDDAKPGNILLKQGDTQEFPPAQKQIKLNLGNRLALKLRINNREATFPANTPKFSAQVVISRDNLQTFFQ